MQYHVTHRTIYHYTAAAPICHNLVRLAPRSLPSQFPRDHRLDIRPEPATRSHRFDYFGNQVDYFTVQEAHRELEVTATSVVDVSLPPVPTSVVSWEQVAAQLQSDRSPQALEAYQLSLPTPRTASLDTLRDYARPSFAERRPVLDVAEELMARLHADFAFDPQATTVHASCDELLTLRRGVCQDFAHLAIACFRAMGLAARYVSGYVYTAPPPGLPRLIGADASHAWFSVYGGPAGWVDFDPTNNLRVAAGHVTIAWGRDYGDVCPIQGVFVGGGQHSMHVGVDVIPVDGDDGAALLAP